MGSIPYFGLRNGVCDVGAENSRGAFRRSGRSGRDFCVVKRHALLGSVETTSARHLSTEISARQQTAPRLARSQALQRSILALMRNPGRIDPQTGMVAASYAHPMFWAPFILVGKGAP